MVIVQGILIGLVFVQGYIWKFPKFCMFPLWKMDECVGALVLCD